MHWPSNTSPESHQSLDSSTNETVRIGRPNPHDFCSECLSPTPWNVLIESFHLFGSRSPLICYREVISNQCTPTQESRFDY